MTLLHSVARSLIRSRSPKVTMNDSVHTNTVSDSHNNSPSIPPKKSDDRNEPKPLLFPKQYYLDQRTPGPHNSFSSDTNTESPAVPRKLKPHSGLPVSPPSSLPSSEPSFDSVPYRETSAVKVTVVKNFEEPITKSEKDVLVQFYAPRYIVFNFNGLVYSHG